MIEQDREGPIISLVAAVALNGVIGAGGGLAWRISDDLKWFKRRTLGKPVIMGRKTFDSIGKPLPDRENIVISRQAAAPSAGLRWVDSIDASIAAATVAAKSLNSPELCVIGGADVYAQFLAHADRIYFTKVNAVVAGDVSFPAINPSDWRKIRVGEATKSEKNEHSCEFFIMDRMSYS